MISFITAVLILNVLGSEELGLLFSDMSFGGVNEELRTFVGTLAWNSSSSPLGYSECERTGAPCVDLNSATRQLHADGSAPPGKGQAAAVDPETRGGNLGA